MTESLYDDRRDLSSFRWGVIRRLEFMEFRLYWDGRINRSDLTGFFGISVPQASADLARYQQIAPNNVIYDKRAKTYFASKEFTPAFIKPSAEQYLSQLRRSVDEEFPGETWARDLPSVSMLPLPRRQIQPDILRSVVATIRGRLTLEIRYQSLNRPRPIWRWITPKALGFDGMRWHIRAFCHIDHAYKDFLFPRVLDVRETRTEQKALPEDRAWLEFVQVRLGPDPRLTPEQKKVIALDYGMIGGECRLEVRRASLFYFLRRLGLDPRHPSRPARDQQIIVLNADEVETKVKDS